MTIPVKVAAASLNQTPLDWDANCANILAAIEAARDQQVSVLCLPELCITGYGCEDAFLAAGVRRTAYDVLREIAPATRGLIVSVGLPVTHAARVFNAACLLVDGRIAGFVGKQNLAGDGIHYEPRWFQPWPAGLRSELEFDGVRYPIGDVIFRCGDVRIGFEICEDAWVAKRPGGDLAHRGVDVILNPSASHFAFGKRVVREHFVLEGSRAFQVSYVYANLLGNEAGRAIYDGDAMIASGGRLLATGRRFSYAAVQLTAALIDVARTRVQRAGTAQPAPAATHDAGRCVTVDFAFPAASWEEPALTVPGWERGAFVKEEELTRAVALGLFDYLRKSRSEGFVVSLSGGADSAAVACLAALLIRFGEAELGRGPFRDKLAYSSRLRRVGDDQPLVGRLLSCVYQSTRNSSTTTRDAARAVAAALGAELLELDVDPLVQQYVAAVSAAVGRPLSWQEDDIALQNVQARARSPGVWMLANLRRALLLSTGNRSEAAVGYATMDGDTSGGLAPLAGVDKAFLRQWLVWLEQRGPAEVGPIPALAAVTGQQPTAELRPPAAHQTDEDDLMPYEVLAAIERAAIHDRLMPVDVFHHLAAQYGGRYTRSALGGWVDRFFRLWSRSQWKRERYAPSFHLDTGSLDPKTWCRFPILSGGFQRELGALQALLASLPTVESPGGAGDTAAR